MKAGKALSEALFKTIPRSIYNGFSLSDPKIWQAFINHGLVDKTDPEAMEASDPDLVVVGIGAHPQK